jgi:hypothetical protein
VVVVLCDPALAADDAGRLACARDARSPRAVGSGAVLPGSFAYDWAATPRPAGLQPARGPAGNGSSLLLTVVGERLGGAASVALTPAPTAAGGSGGGAWTCNVTAANDTAAACVLPAGLPAGRYALSVTQAPGGAQSAGGPVYTAEARVGALRGNAGGAAGGGALTLLSPPGEPGGFNSTHPFQNRVWVGGLPCAVEPASVSAGSLGCVVPSLLGWALVEFWRLPLGSGSLPDLRAWAQPGARRAGVSGGWGLSDSQPVGVAGALATTNPSRCRVFWPQPICF